VGGILSLRVVTSPMTHLVCKCSDSDMRDQFICVVESEV
jgi:hypothetical protein